jgi:pimeloyl-ACP methyl ester carboxylesterase
MQRRHTARHLLARGGVAAVGGALMLTGLYPLLPHAVRVVKHDAPSLRSVFAEWGWAALASLARPLGFLPLAGAHVRGPRPVIVLHGYAMNRANFALLARRLAAAGLGPVYGFEYWTLGRVARASHQLADFVAEVRAQTGAAQVDVIGHSMGGVVARYYVAFGGGDGVVAHLVTLGSPHLGSDLSALGLGHARRELVAGSHLLERLAVAPPPAHTRVTSIWSRADELVPGARQTPLAGAETILVDDIGHVGLLASGRVAHAIIARLQTASPSSPARS